LVEKWKGTLELIKSDGSFTIETSETEYVISEFCAKLFHGKTDNIIIDSEVENVNQHLQGREAADADGLIGEILKGGKELLITPLKRLFNNIIECQQISSEKNPPTEEMQITWQQKLSPNIIPTRKRGFRPGKSTADHLHVLVILIKNLESTTCFYTCCLQNTKNVGFSRTHHPIEIFEEHGGYILQ
uniref:Reverse transcriptase domain-containing protein n=1 Tax=Toxocara canis TaxID=6265 RepID=A0A183VEU9_TOXCA